MVKKGKKKGYVGNKKSKTFFSIRVYSCVYVCFQVVFSDTLHVCQVMYTWKYAYRRVRLDGAMWEMCARDRCRFQCRINKLENMLSEILSLKHRNKIKQQIFAKID